MSNLKDNLIDIINDFGSISTDFPLHVVGDWFTINSWKGYAFSKQCQVLLLSYIIEDKYNIKIRAIQYGDFIGFQIYEDGNINVYKNGKIVDKKSVEAFSRSPNSVFRLLQKSITGEVTDN